MKKLFGIFAMLLLGLTVNAQRYTTDKEGNIINFLEILLLQNYFLLVIQLNIKNLQTQIINTNIIMKMNQK